jgi:DNA-binding transcriptional MerR regulator
MTAPTLASSHRSPVAPLSLVPHAVEAPAPVTITAGEMVRLTGVARERLRTWERRHGFPEPVRARNNVRRYLAEDVRYVAAVSQLSANGVPLAEAIETVLATRGTPGTLESLGSALDHAPAPAIAISGGDALQVAWVNGTTRVDSFAPQVGDRLAGEAILGAGACEQIRELLLQRGASFSLITHQDWMGTFPSSKRSIAWRLASVGTGEPVVVLLQLPESMAPGRQVSPDSPLRKQGTQWAAGLADARRELQGGSGLSSVQRALRALVQGTDAADGFLALCHGELLRTATSVRGTVPPRSAARADCPDLNQAIVDGEVDWLCDASLRSLQLDERVSAVVVPMIGSGEVVGVAVLTFAHEVGLGDAARELMMGFGMMAAATVLRERSAAAVAAPAAAVAPAAPAARLAA